MQNKKRLVELLVRLKSANNFYSRASDTERGRILDALERTFDELETFGYHRSFGVLWTLYGNEFTKFEFKRSMEEYIATL